MAHETEEGWSSLSAINNNVWTNYASVGPGQEYETFAALEADMTNKSQRVLAIEATEKGEDHIQILRGGNMTGEMDMIGCTGINNISSLNSSFDFAPLGNAKGVNCG